MIQQSYQIIRVPLPAAPVSQDASRLVHFRHVHRGTLHLRIGEPELVVDVVDVLEELEEVPAGRLDRGVVAEVTEVPHETLAEEFHEAVVGGAGHDGARRRQVGHDVVRVHLMGVEDGVLAVGHLQDLLPYFFAVLDLKDTDRSFFRGAQRD